MADFAAIDWQQPWLASVRAVGESVAAQVLQGRAVYEVLNEALPAALAGWRFVPQSALPDGVAYESHIYTAHCIPTRDNLHDFFNGLMWLHWPHLKQHFNRLHFETIQREGVQARRGPVRDTLTVLDENGAIWCAPQPLIDALQAKQWQRLMVELRPLWAHSCLVPVGHALLEKLVAPRKPMCAHVLCMAAAPGVPLPTPPQAPLAWDVLVQSSAALQPAQLVGKPLSPLPVLGVPGWWAGNENFSFYDDSQVFRSAPPAPLHCTA